MGIYKKGNIYWMIKQYRRKKVERSLDTNIKRVAEERYAKIVSEIIDGSYFEQQKALGHKTITMTMRYAHHYPESLRSSVEVLDKNYCDSTTVRAQQV